MTALSRAEPARPGPAHRLLDADTGTRGLAVLSGVLARLVVAHEHGGQGVLPAADRDGHLQGCLGEVGVVVLAEGEPNDPPLTHVQYRVQIELALLGSDRGAVAVPLVVEPIGCESRPIRSGARPRACRVVCLRFLRPRAASPSSRIGAATVFSLTRHPASRRSAVIRGAP